MYLCEFEANLVYKVSPRLITLRNFALKNKAKQTNKKGTKNTQTIHIQWVPTGASLPSASEFLISVAF